MPSNQVWNEKPSTYRKRKLRFAFALLGALAVMPTSGLTQGPTFPSPTATGVIGKRDAGAVNEIKANLVATSAAGWQDLEATGTVTFPDGDAHSASLYLMGAKYARLDIEMVSGTRSLRIGGFAGRSQNEGGSQESLSPVTSSAGIVAFPRIWADGATSSRISLFDLNSYAGAGQSLHRIAIEYPLESIAGERLGSRTAATDLYFDPSTHLLAYSVDSVTLNGASGQIFIRVMSYADYQHFSGIKIPGSIKQYLDGQLQWTLQISQVTVNTAPPAPTFSF